ncbi:glycosyltransferase family 39 protein, partial [Pseudomonadota bacterium]
MEKQSLFKSSRWKEVSIGRFFALALVIGVTYRIVRWSIGMPLWGDEVMLALNLSDRSLMELFTPLQMNQVAPPFFLWLGWLNINIVGNSELVLRFPSLLASIASLLVMYFLSRKLLDVKEALLAVSILAVTYYTMRYGAELKPYSIDLLVALTVLFIGHQFRSAESKSLYFVLFIIVLPIGTFLSFPSVFVVASALTALFVDRLIVNDKKRLIIVFITGVTALVLFLVNYYYFLRPHSAHPFLKFFWKNAFPTNDLYGFIVWLVRESTGRIMAYPIGGGSGGSIVTAAFVTSGIYVLWKDKRRFLLALLVLPFLFSWLAAIVQAYPYGFRARIAQHLAPSICMLAGVGIVYWLTRFSETKEKLITKTKLTCLIFCCLGLIGIGYTIAKPYKTKFDWEVRNIVESFFRDHECQTVLIPNR